MNEVERVALDLELSDGKYDDLVAAQDYPGIVALMRARPTVANPEAQGVIPKRYTLSEFLPIVGPTVGLEIFKVPGLVDRIENSLQANDRETLGNLLALVSGLLSAEQQAALGVMLAETESDPTWTAEIAGESVQDRLGFRVTEHDVQAVLA